MAMSPKKTPERAAGARKKKKPLTPKERAKLRVARELGLYEQVRQLGWGGLSAKECGRVGGILSKKMRLSQRIAGQGRIE